MTTPIEKRNANKFCEFHGEVGHTTDECMHLKRQIEEMIKAGKLIRNKRLNPYGTAMAEGSQTKDYSNFLSGVSDLIPTLRGGRWDGRFRLEVKSQMVPATTQLVGFNGEIIWPPGQISLLVKIGNEEHSTSAWMNFMAVSYGWNSHVTEQHDYSARVQNGLRAGTQQPVIDQVTKEKVMVAIHPEYPEQTIAISSTLTEEGRTERCRLLRCNLNIFA
ncbi:hypothetical protein Tco_0168867 [Tanacetum coccineum]